MLKEVYTQAGTDLASKIEVTKNTKGHTWTIGLRCETGKEEALIERLKFLNELMKKSFTPDEV